MDKQKEIKVADEWLIRLKVKSLFDSPKPLERIVVYDVTPNSVRLNYFEKNPDNTTLEWWLKDEVDFLEKLN